LGVLDHRQLTLRELDLCDPYAVRSLIGEEVPNEIYNLAAQSFVGSSFNHPSHTVQVNSIGVLNLLEAVRHASPDSRFYQASTSEMFGKVQAVPQTEETPFYPRSPYGISKLFAHWMTVNYRESYGLFGASGILFNHESPLRGMEFVTRKISCGVAGIALGRQESLVLGNLDAIRDWGYAEDYVEGMWRILQSSVADTFVLATGRQSTVREFLTHAFAIVGIDISFEGSGASEVGLDKKTSKVLVSLSESLFRPAEVDLLVGSPEKARKELGWCATTALEELISLMVSEDLRRVKGAV